MNFCRPFPIKEPTECLEWICVCNDTNASHTAYGDIPAKSCTKTKKEKFKFLHNNNCTLECQFYTKLLQSKGEQK